MSLELNAVNLRVLGCLMEKSVITPDQYPMTLNALTNACNQKSSREPVMSLEQGEVARALRELQDLHVVRREENFKSQTEKFSHRFCNTPFSDYQLDPAEFAILTVLFLRGPRTPGELRANSGRLHTFADNGAVVEALDGLMVREGDALVVKLARQAGRKDSQYMHVFSDVPPSTIDTSPVSTSAAPVVGQVAESGLEARVARLEMQVQELQQLLAERPIEAAGDDLNG